MMLCVTANIDAGIMNDVLGKNIEVITTSLQQAQASASGILLSLAIIEIALLGIASLFGSSPAEVIHDLFRKSLLIAVFFFLVSSWGSLANEVRDYVVGGAAGQTQVQLALNPSYIAEQGVQKVAFIFNEKARAKLMAGGFSEQANKLSGASGLDLLMDDKPALEHLVESSQMTAMTLLMGLTFMLLALLIIAAHFYVALQIYVTTIEFYMVAGLAVLFVPFGINRHTSFLANNAFGALVAQSVKLAVLVALVQMMGPLIQALELSSEPTLYELLSMLLGASAFAYVTSRAPSVAQDVFSGAGGGIDVHSTMRAASDGATSLVFGAASAGTSAAVGASQAMLSQGSSGGAGAEGSSTQETSSLVTSASSVAGAASPAAGLPDAPQSSSAQGSDNASSATPPAPPAGSSSEAVAGQPDQGSAGEPQGGDDVDG